MHLLLSLDQLPSFLSEDTPLYVNTHSINNINNRDYVPSSSDLGDNEYNFDLAENIEDESLLPDLPLHLLLRVHHHPCVRGGQAHQEVEGEVCRKYSRTNTADSLVWTRALLAGPSLRRLPASPLPALLWAGFRFPPFYDPPAPPYASASARHCAL